MLNVKVYNSAIQKRLNKYGLFSGRAFSLLKTPKKQKRHEAAVLRFAKLHLNKPKDVSSNFLMDRSDQSEQLIPTAKLDGGELII